MKSSQSARLIGCLSPSHPTPGWLSAVAAVKRFILANPDCWLFFQKASDSQQNREVNRLQVSIQCATVCPGGQKQNIAFIGRILVKSRIHTALLLFNMRDERIDGLPNLFAFFRQNIHFDIEKSHRFPPQWHQEGCIVLVAHRTHTRDLQNVCQGDRSNYN